MRYITSLLLVMLCLSAGQTSAGTYGEIQPDSVNLVALWHFNDSLADSSGNGYTLTAVGTPATTVDGQFGNAHNYPGSVDYVKTTAFSESIHGSGTIICWLNPSDWNQTGYQFFFNTESSSNKNEIKLGIQSGTLDVTYRLSFAVLWTSHTYDVSGLDGWHFFAMTWIAGDYLRVWIDGNVAYDETSLSISMALTGATIYIGADMTGGALEWTGDIDEVAIFDTNLSDQTIMQIYAMQKGGYGVVD